MNLGVSLHANTQGFVPHDLGHVLGYLQEKAKSIKNRNSYKRPGFIKDYINCNFAIIVHLRPKWQFGDYHLIFLGFHLGKMKEVSPKPVVIAGIMVFAA